MRIGVLTGGGDGIMGEAQRGAGREHSFGLIADHVHAAVGAALQRVPVPPAVAGLVRQDLLGPECEAGGLLKHAYFPQGTVLSLLTVLGDGSAIETDSGRTEISRLSPTDSPST